MPHTPVISTYYLDKSFDIPSEEAWKIGAEFWGSDDFLSLPPMPCAAGILPRLHAAGYEFVAITACEDTARVRQGRLKNLEAAFGFRWAGIHCTIETGKAVILDVYDPAIWVEDHLANCLAGAAAGHRAFLLDRKHNADARRAAAYTRIQDWNEIAPLALAA
jgi:hypothetical protein